MFIPKPLHHESYEYGERPMSGGAAPVIVIHVLRENKRPVGFLPWPAEPKPEKKKRKKA